MRRVWSRSSSPSCFPSWSARTALVVQGAAVTNNGTHPHPPSPVEIPERCKPSDTQYVFDIDFCSEKYHLDTVGTKATGGYLRVVDETNFPVLKKSHVLFKRGCMRNIHYHFNSDELVYIMRGWAPYLKVPSNATEDFEAILAFLGSHIQSMDLPDVIAPISPDSLAESPGTTVDVFKLMDFKHGAISCGSEEPK
eukprot:Nk52_evm67s226 gene=Nk52_evmTU67s226